MGDLPTPSADGAPEPPEQPVVEPDPHPIDIDVPVDLGDLLETLGLPRPPVEAVVKPRVAVGPNDAHLQLGLELDVPDTGLHLDQDIDLVVPLPSAPPAPPGPSALSG